MTTTPITPGAAASAPLLLAQASRLLEQESFTATGARRRALLMLVDYLRALLPALRKLQA